MRNKIKKKRGKRRDERGMRDGENKRGGGGCEGTKG